MEGGVARNIAMFAEMLTNIAPAEPTMKPGNTNGQYLSGPSAKENNTSPDIIISAPQSMGHLALMFLSLFNLLAKLKTKAVMPIGSIWIAEDIALHW